MATLQSVATPTTKPKWDSWPMDRPTEEVIAERLLASALYNFHLVRTRQQTPFADFRTWDQLTDEQQAFLIDWAIPQAMTAIWKGR